MSKEAPETASRAGERGVVTGKQVAGFAEGVGAVAVVVSVALALRVTLTQFST